MNDIIVEKEIDGVIYKARFKGIAYSLSLESRLKHANASFQLSEILFKEVLVSPKIEIDDLDLQTYRKVHSFLLSVANGEFEKKLSNTKLKQRAKDNWSLWRLVLSNRGFDFQTVFGKPFMTPQDATEANYALDIQIDAEKKAAKRKK